MGDTKATLGACKTPMLFIIHAFSFSYSISFLFNLIKIYNTNQLNHIGKRFQHVWGL